MNHEELVKLFGKEEFDFYHNCLRQYEELEKLVLETDKFCAISPLNEKTFSLQYNFLLQNLCSEVDVLIKRLCYEYDKSKNVKNMFDYINVITSNDPDFKNITVKLGYYDIEIKPWYEIKIIKENGKEKVICPYWWNGYTNVKHKRLIFNLEHKGINIFNENIQLANQKNVLGALAGLFVLEIKCFEKMRTRHSEELKKNFGVDETVEVIENFNSIFLKNIKVSLNI